MKLTQAQSTMVAQFVQTHGSDSIDNTQLEKLARQLGVASASEAKGILSSWLKTRDDDPRSGASLDVIGKSLPPGRLQSTGRGAGPQMFRFSSPLAPTGAELWANPSDDAKTIGRIANAVAQRLGLAAVGEAHSPSNRPGVKAQSQAPSAAALWAESAGSVEREALLFIAVAKKLGVAQAANIEITAAPSSPPSESVLWANPPIDMRRVERIANEVAKQLRPGHVATPSSPTEIGAETVIDDAAMFIAVANKAGINLANSFASKA